MELLQFTGQHNIDGEELVLSAMLCERSITVRTSIDLALIYGVGAVQEKAVDKAKRSQFDPAGNIAVFAADLG